MRWGFLVLAVVNLGVALMPPVWSTRSLPAAGLAVFFGCMFLLERKRRW